MRSGEDIGGDVCPPCREMKPSAVLLVWPMRERGMGHVEGDRSMSYHCPSKQDAALSRNHVLLLRVACFFCMNILPYTGRHVWRSGGVLNGDARTDGGREVKAYDVSHVLLCSHPCGFKKVFSSIRARLPLITNAR